MLPKVLREKDTREIVGGSPDHVCTLLRSPGASVSALRANSRDAVRPQRHIVRGQNGRCILPEQLSERERDRCSRIGLIFDGVAQRPLKGTGGLGGAVDGSVLEILGGRSSSQLCRRR
jgi:hypothetical protein